jgi:hypothetical protein
LPGSWEAFSTSRRSPNEGVVAASDRLPDLLGGPKASITSPACGTVAHRNHITIDHALAQGGAGGLSRATCPHTAAEVGRVAKDPAGTTAGDCRSARHHHGAGGHPPPLFKTVADMTVGLHEFVIEAPRRDVFSVMPTEARPAAFRGETEGSSIRSSEI